MEYILVLWPESQMFMEMDWFRSEAYLCQAFEDQEHHDSAYFIPKERYEECSEKDDIASYLEEYHD